MQGWLSIFIMIALGAAAPGLAADAPKLKDLPIIMITSRIAQKHRDYAAELGVDATEVVGGVEAWQSAGLPMADGPADVRE